MSSAELTRLQWIAQNSQSHRWSWLILPGHKNQIDMNTSERFVDSSECGQGSREMECEGDQHTRHTHRDLLK